MIILYIFAHVFVYSAIYIKYGKSSDMIYPSFIFSFTKINFNRVCRHFIFTIFQNCLIATMHYVHIMKAIPDRQTLDVSGQEPYPITWVELGLLTPSQIGKYFLGVCHLLQALMSTFPNLFTLSQLLIHSWCLHWICIPGKVWGLISQHTLERGKLNEQVTEWILGILCPY